MRRAGVSAEAGACEAGARAEQELAERLREAESSPSLRVQECIACCVNVCCSQECVEHFDVQRCTVAVQ